MSRTTSSRALSLDWKLQAHPPLPKAGLSLVLRAVVSCFLELVGVVGLPRKATDMKWRD